MSTDEIKQLTERIEKLESAEGGKKRRKKDPNAPKKAPSAYNKYVKEQFNVIKEENPNMKFGDIQKEVSKRWKAKKETPTK